MISEDVLRRKIPTHKRCTIGYLCGIMIAYSNVYMTWTRAFLGRCSFKIEAIAKGERKMTILLIFTALTVVGYLVSLGIYLITKRKKLVPWMYKLNKASIVLVASVFVLTVFC